MNPERGTNGRPLEGGVLFSARHARRRPGVVQFGKRYGAEALIVRAGLFASHQPPQGQLIRKPGCLQTDGFLEGFQGLCGLRGIRASDLS